jgi:hypothetical protein
MSTTSNLSITPSDGWVEVASSPNAVTVSNNSGNEYYVAFNDVVPTIQGELVPAGQSYMVGAFTGKLWIRATANVVNQFAVTVG